MKQQTKGIRAAVLGFALATGVLCAGCSAGTSGTDGDAEPASEQTEQVSPSPLVNDVTDQEEVVYCLYLGLTDRDTGKQELTMAEAKELAIPLFLEAGSGYTVYEAEGGFAAQDGTIVRNDTLVFDSTHGDEQSVRQLIDRLQQTLNLESVYCESKTVGYHIYGGVVAGVE